MIHCTGSVVNWKCETLVMCYTGSVIHFYCGLLVDNTMIVLYTVSVVHW